MPSAFLRAVDPARLALAACCVPCFVAGTFAGLIASFADRDAMPVLLSRGSGATVAAVTLEGFRDGVLRGRSEGPVRLFAGEDAVDVSRDGTFALDHPGFHVNEVTVPVPAGMAFVASRQGKKYYAVTSAAGARIAPKNRVYFPDAASAEAAGFVR